MIEPNYSELINSYLNNLNKNTLKNQSRIISQTFKNYPEIKPFFTKNLANRRVISEPNNLEVYAKLVENLNDEELDNYLLKDVADLCKDLLEKQEVNKNIKDAIRNVGSFLGLITIARNKPIIADVFDFRALLENAIKSKNEARLNLTVALVTHVFKFCQRSVIFNKQCTWVARIIDVLNQIHDTCNKTNSGLQTALEIERFNETIALDVANTSETEEEETSEQDLPDLIPYQMQSQVNENEQQVYPMVDYMHYDEIQQPVFYSQMHQGYQMHAPIYQAHQYQHHPTNMLDLRVPPPSVQQTPQRFFNQLQQTPQRHFVGMNETGTTPQRHYQPQFSSNSQGFPLTPYAMQPRPTPQSSQMIQQSSMYTVQEAARRIKLEQQQTAEDPLLHMIIKQLDFSEAPIFTIFRAARSRVITSFSVIMKEIEDRFIQRNLETLVATCEAFLLRDMAFCNDEQQLRKGYQLAIRTYLLAMLQPRCTIGSVRNHLQNKFKQLFTEIVDDDKGFLHHNIHDNDKFIVNCVNIFMQKNQAVFTDGLCALVDQHAGTLADQSSTRCLMERGAIMLGHQSRELKRFIGEPNNLDEINERLPKKLRRNLGLLDAEDYQIYQRFEEFDDEFHSYMEKYGLNGSEQVEKMWKEERANQSPDDVEEESDLAFFDNPLTSQEAEANHFGIKESDNLETYIEALYKENPTENPKYFFEYIRLLSQRSFLDRLAGNELSEEQAQDRLIMLTLPILRVVWQYAEKGQLINTNQTFNSSLVDFFMLLTHEFPEIFDKHYLICSATIPDVMIHLRNMIMDCKPRDIHLPSISLDLNSLRLQMQNDLSFNIEEQCTMEQALKDIILAQFNDGNHAKFSKTLIKAFKKDLSEEAIGTVKRYDRSLMLHTIVYIAHLSIKAIQKRGLTVNCSNLTGKGQIMLIKLINDMDIQGRFTFLTLIADQLRYPSTMTCYFICFLLNMFATTNKVEIQELISRIIIERFLPPAPYPWGLCVIVHELLNNPIFKFKSNKFLNCSQDIKDLVMRIESIIAVKAD